MRKKTISLLSTKRGSYLFRKVCGKNSNGWLKLFYLFFLLQVSAEKNISLSNQGRRGTDMCPLRFPDLPDVFESEYQKQFQIPVENQEPAAAFPLPPRKSKALELSKITETQNLII